MISQTCLAIWALASWFACSAPLPAQVAEQQLAELAALLHDVADHKYRRAGAAALVHCPLGMPWAAC